MAVILQRLREIHQLGSATREWLVTSRRVPAFAGHHTRIAGFTEARAGFTFVRHHPRFSMLLATESGAGRAWVDGTWQPCPAGHAYVTAPGTPHAYHIQPGRPWRLHWVIYEESAQLPGLPPGCGPRVIPVEAVGLRHAVEGLCHENAGRGDVAVMEFWAALVDRMALRLLETKTADPRLERLWHAVHADLGGDWPLRRMARIAGIGEEGLRRLCRSQLRATPVAHLTQLRMLTAADLLRHTEEKVASVANRLGYSDAFAFSTAFKRVLGQSPQAFRRPKPGPA